jgi:uncharacterized repeat protein (TIGR01451 family)
MFISRFHLTARSRRIRRRMAAALTAATLLASTGVFGVGSVSAAVTPQTGAAGALAIAQALASPSTDVTGASFESVTGDTPDGTSTTSLDGFPTDGTSFGILTTGNVTSVPNPGTFASTDNGGAAVRGDTDRDVTVLKTDISVPEGANCLTFDFKFLSEEYPHFVGTEFNDAFIAELDGTTWTTSGSAISAPNNFAFDSSNDVVSINSTGLGGMSAANGAGTAFDGITDGNGGATGLLHASTQVTAGAHSVYFSIFDQGDSGYDSAVFLDNLAVGFVANPADNCKPGAAPVNFKLSLTPATATNPIGTQHLVTATLTDAADNPVDSALISFTVAGVNPDSGSGTTDENGEATFSYTGNNAGQDQISACYDADSSPPCEATASATKDWTAPPTSADLSLTKSDSPDPVTVGGDVTYTLTVHNGGPDAAADATVTDALPAGVTFKSASSGCGEGEGGVTCAIDGPINNGQDVSVQIVVTTTEVGTISNTASVSSTTSDPDPDNNTAGADTTVSSATIVTCPEGQTCDSPPITSPGGTVVTITAGDGATITAEFIPFDPDSFTPCKGQAPRDPGNVLSFTVDVGSKTLTVTVNGKPPVAVCWNSENPFKQRDGKNAKFDSNLHVYYGLLPDCKGKNPVGPCVLPPLPTPPPAKGHPKPPPPTTTTVRILAPAGDPKARF